MNIAPIVSKVWSLCTTLCDDGVSYTGTKPTASAAAR